MASSWKTTSYVLFNLWKDFFRYLFTRPFPIKETLKQFRNVISDGWGTILAGSVVQGVFIMWFAGFYGKRFGAYNWVGAITAYAVFREFAVIMSGVLFSGRIGTAFTVEIGSMQLSEQISALKLMNISPVKQLVVPRVLATVLALPVFTAFSFGMAVISSWLLMYFFWDMSFQIFFQNAFNLIPVGMLTNSLLRAMLIGLVISINSLAYGFYPCQGAQELGQITTKSIVVNLFCVLLLDLVVGIFTTLGM